MTFRSFRETYAPKTLWRRKAVCKNMNHALILQSCYFNMSLRFEMFHLQQVFTFRKFSAFVAHVSGSKSFWACEKRTPGATCKTCFPGALLHSLEETKSFPGCFKTRWLWSMEIFFCYRFNFLVFLASNVVKPK